LPRGVVGEAIRGDLNEEFTERVLSAGGRAANAWYRRQGRRLIVDYLLRHRIRRPIGGRLGRGPAGEPRRGRILEQIAMDTALAIRALRREPGLFLTVIVVLALGIGANTAVYSVVHAVLLEPLPYPEPDRLVRVKQTLSSWVDHANPILSGMANDFPVEWGVFRDWERLNQSFDALGVYRQSRYAFTGESRPEWIDAAQTSSGVFVALGVRPALGRLFSSEDDLVGGERTVILSHSFWTTAFGADPRALGDTIVLTGVAHRIIGVMPPDFYFPTRAVALWTRMQDRYIRVYEGGQSLDGLARLRPGTSIDNARRDMAMVSATIIEERPGRGDGFGVRLWRQREYLVGDVRPVMTMLLAAVGTVLLIACANASGLMLIRAARRRREIALRASLGAGRRRILAQLLTESTLLAVLAGMAALVMTVVTQRLLVAMLPSGVSNADGISFDKSVLLFCIAASLGSGLLIGILPALRASRAAQASVLHGGGRSMTAGRSRLRAQRLLVVAEVALTVPLVVGAGLLTESLSRLTAVDLGFDPSGVLSLRNGLFGERYDSDEEVRLFYETLRERLGAIPGVLEIGAGDQPPFGEGGSGGGLRIGEGDDAIEANPKWTHVEGRFFAVFDIPIVSGRAFRESDFDRTDNVAIINEAMARRFWPDSDPLGAIIYKSGEEEGGRRIVGVAGDVKRGSPDASASSLVYLPGEATSTTFVKSAGNIGGFRTAVERVALEIDPDMPLTVTSVEERVWNSTAAPRFRALLISLFAGLAATLALVGVGGILSYTVTQQRREIGLRLAVGATADRVMRMVLGNGVRLVAAGLLIGGSIAALAVRLIRSFLYETSVTDPTILVGAAVLLVCAGLAASLLPARRAARIDPMIALRAE